MIEERIHLIQYVRRWGSSISDAILNPQCQVFSLPTIEGLIGYYATSSCVIVMGNPLCAIENWPLLVKAFHQFCQEKKQSVIYLVVSKNFVEWAMQHVCQAFVEFGEELNVDPHHDLRKAKGSHAVLLRKKIKHAVLEKTVIHEYIPHQADLEQKIEEVSIEWTKARQGAQIYVSPIKLFSDQLGKRWFYAQKGEQIVGIAALHQLQVQQGWLLNHLLTKNEAANGTSELLIASVLEKLAEENCSYLSFGIIPGNQLNEIKGLGTLSTWLGHLVFKVAQQVFHLGGRKKFWEKFDPRCSPSYLLFSQHSIRIIEVINLLKALNVKR